MSKEEAIKLAEESKWLVGKSINGDKISKIGIMPMNDHPNFSKIVVAIRFDQDHWPLMNDVSDFEVFVFYSVIGPFNPFGSHQAVADAIKDFSVKP